MLGDLRNAHGERLDHAWHAPAGDAPRATTVAIGHGVTADKDREWAGTLADALAAAGFGSLRFSFAGNGDSEGRFEDSCPTKGAEDLGSVLDALQAAGRGPLVYVGHSMGAAVGVLRASHDDRIAALVSLAGMVDTAGFARRKFGDLEPGQLMWDKPECPLSSAFLDDMAVIGSVESLAARIEVPWLLVHGDADTVVPPEESEAIARRAAGPVEVSLLPGVDHVFTDTADATAAVVVAWLSARDELA